MQGSFSKYYALAAVLTLLGAPLSAYAAAGTGGAPDCQAKGDQATTAQTCENSKSQGSGGASNNGG